MRFCRQRLDIVIYIYIYIVTNYLKAYKTLKTVVLRLVSDIFPVLILYSWWVLDNVKWLISTLTVRV